MLVNVVNRDLPPCIAVAKITLCPVFAPVNIGVTILALLAGVGEDQVVVAVAAAYLGVQAAQCESRLAMIELRNGPDRRPPFGGMAILARNIQLSMRAACLLF